MTRPSRPWWRSRQVHAVLVGAWFVGSVASISAVSDGRQWLHHDAGLLLFSVLALVVATLLQEASYRRLPHDVRRRVDAVVRTGTPVGDDTVDDLATARLTRLTRSPVASSRAVALALQAATCVLPVVAVLRVSPWFWAAVPVPVVILLRSARSARGPGPCVRLERLRAARGGDGSG